MSRKSRRHGRHMHQSKRRKFRQGFSTPPQAVAVQPAAASQGYATPRAEVVVPAAKVPAPKATVTPALSINVGTELRMIAILAGIILVILVVLALTLR
jgi:hypothetical protein